MPNHSLKCPLCESESTALYLTAPDRFHWRRDAYKMIRCSVCSCVWLADPPKPQDMGFHYSQEYHQVIMSAGETWADSRWRRQRETIAKNKSGGAVLDIGCSSGGFLGTMKGQGWKLYGIEMEASTAEKARAATGAEVFVGDALEAPFAAASFDVITAFDVLEHVYSPKQFLTKVLEWLKPGGIFYTGLPNINSWEARILGSYWYGLELPRHLFHFSPKSLRYVMKDLGFKEISLTTPHTTYIERSASYIYSASIEKLGITPESMAKHRRRTLPSRAVRKLFRVSVIAPFGAIASSSGAGASIEAIFGKTDSSVSRQSDTIRGA